MEELKITTEKMIMNIHNHDVEKLCPYLLCTQHPGCGPSIPLCGRSIPLCGRSIPLCGRSCTICGRSWTICGSVFSETNHITKPYVVGASVVSFLSIFAMWSEHICSDHIAEPDVGRSWTICGRSWTICGRSWTICGRSIPPCSRSIPPCGRSIRDVVGASWMWSEHIDYAYVYVNMDTNLSIPSGFRHGTNSNEISIDYYRKIVKIKMSIL